jgi:cytidine deaminase
MFSGYKVTGIVECRVAEKYIYFQGVNVENADAGLGTHGEEGALIMMITALGPGSRASTVWVMGGGSQEQDDRIGSCCGRCRQRIAGLTTEDAVIFNVSLSGKVLKTGINELLPHSFSFQNLPGYSENEKPGEMNLSTNDNDLGSRLLRSGHVSEKEVAEWAISLRSVSLASQVNQSAIIELENGYYVAGVRIEDAAYTGINAIQAAKANATAIFGEQKISRLWLHSKKMNANAIVPLSIPLSTYQITGPGVEVFDVVQEDDIRPVKLSGVCGG